MSVRTYHHYCSNFFSKFLPLFVTYQVKLFLFYNDMAFLLIFFPFAVKSNVQSLLYFKGYLIAEIVETIFRFTETALFPVPVLVKSLQTPQRYPYGNVHSRQ